MPQAPSLVIGWAGGGSRRPAENGPVHPRAYTPHTQGNRLMVPDWANKRRKMIGC